MTLRRSQRKPKPVTIWEEKGAPSAAKDPKITQKNARTEKQTALKPIATGPLPESIGLDEKRLPELPTYKPPLELQYKPSESLSTGLSQLDTFQRLLTPDIIDRIVEATNSYAVNAREIDEEPNPHIRAWKPVNSTDIWRYIGCLLYMGYHKEGRHEEHWEEKGYLKEFLSLIRFQQIHRYFTLRDRSVEPYKKNETFAWQVEPIGSIIKQNCKALWQPSSHLAIDEAMIAYRGRTSHKVKLPNKPIKEGYKVWVLGDSGYIYDWLWYSRIDGPEDIPSHGLDVKRVKEKDLTELIQVRLAPTFALVIRLAQRLRQIHPTRVFCFFLDNLFLNINVSQALLALHICCTGTTRKNAQGIPEWLLKMKEHNRGLVWNSMLAQIVDSTLCFLWQDNNAVLGLTTAHCLKDDTIERLRKRPSPTSTNARIVRPVFGDLPFKRLQIPRAIDDYNHYMNGVDRSNQLRKNLTVHRAYERRIWRPLWYYILDVCAVNGYLIWKGDTDDRAKRGQRRFRGPLIKALLNTPYPEAQKPVRGPYKGKPMPQPNQDTQDHHWRPFLKRGYCIWCKKNAQEWKSKRVRPALVEIVNQATPSAVQRQSQTYGGCMSCGAYLCSKGACFEQYHRQ
jgi:Transposase IS4